MWSVTLKTTETRAAGARYERAEQIQRQPTRGSARHQATEARGVLGQALPSSGFPAQVQATISQLPATTLPHRERISAAFGDDQIADIKCHVGGPAGQLAAGLGAKALAVGEHIAFRNSPDLRTAAHEAAHVVQQRMGVPPGGYVGRLGDRFEREADASASAVCHGEKAPIADDSLRAGSRISGAASREPALQFDMAAYSGPPIDPAEMGIPNQPVETAVNVGALRRCLRPYLESGDVRTRTLGDWVHFSWRADALPADVAYQPYIEDIRGR